MRKRYILFDTGLGCLVFLVLLVGLIFAAGSVQLLRLGLVSLPDVVLKIGFYFVLVAGPVLVSFVSLRVCRRAASKRQEKGDRRSD